MRANRFKKLGLPRGPDQRVVARAENAEGPVDPSKFALGALEFCVTHLQSPGHLVEGAGELTDFAPSVRRAGPNTQIPRREAPCGFNECLHRTKDGSIGEEPCGPEHEDEDDPEA